MKIIFIKSAFVAFVSLVTLFFMCMALSSDGKKEHAKLYDRLMSQCVLVFIWLIASILGAIILW